MRISCKSSLLFLFSLEKAIAACPAQSAFVIAPESCKTDKKWSTTLYARKKQAGGNANWKQGRYSSASISSSRRASSVSMPYGKRTSHVLPEDFDLASEALKQKLRDFSKSHGIQRSGTSRPGIPFSKKSNALKVQDTASEKVQDTVSETHRLFVGNLFYDTTVEDVQSLFSHYGEVLMTKLPLNRKAGRCRGFAFVDMETREAQQEAIAGLDGTLLHGRRIRVSEAISKEQGEKLSKIFVGNLSTKLKKEDLFQLYDEHGDVKEVIIPTDNFTGETRGFAFVIFKDDSASKAIEATHGLELQGRSLVVSKALPKGTKAPARSSQGMYARAKLYVGGLSIFSTQDSVKSMFEAYGPVIHCRVPTSKDTGVSLGFAFVTMESQHAYHAMEMLDGKNKDGQTIRVKKYEKQTTRTKRREQQTGPINVADPVLEVESYENDFDLVLAKFSESFTEWSNGFVGAMSDVISKNMHGVNQNWER